MSNTVQRAPGVAGQQPEPGTTGSVWRYLRQAGLFMAKQREATVFLVVILLIVYFGLISSAGRPVFFTKPDLVNLSIIAAPIMIIAYGEVLLLICGEIDLSVGFIYAFTPFIMYFLITYYHFPAFLGIIVAILLVGGGIGWVNAFLTVTLGLPSFVATLGTGFIIGGLTLTMGHGEQAPIPPSALGIGDWFGQANGFAQIIWAAILLVVFHILLRQTPWGLHTIAVGGNALGAREAGVNLARIKFGNFMLTGILGGLAGVQTAFQTNLIDTYSGGAAYQPMFYAVAAAVIGGTAMLGGSGTMIGAFLGAAVLAILIDGFAVIGVSAFPLQIFFGGAILIAMIANVQLARLRVQGRVR